MARLFEKRARATEREIDEARAPPGPRRRLAAPRVPLRARARASRLGPALLTLVSGSAAADPQVAQEGQQGEPDAARPAPKPVRLGLLRRRRRRGAAASGGWRRGTSPPAPLLRCSGLSRASGRGASSACLPAAAASPHQRRQQKRACRRTTICKEKQRRSTTPAAHPRFRGMPPPRSDDREQELRGGVGGASSESGISYDTASLSVARRSTAGASRELLGSQERGRRSGTFTTSSTNKREGCSGGLFGSMTAADV